ncbi:PhzF family phenazine biosynthesis protein [Oxalobacteraceae bacterium GrIS 1.11]
MRTIQLLHCFGARAGAGNPALVIENDHTDAAARQHLAAERQSTCVFIDVAGPLFVLDYFYPHMRSPLCLHATLAAAHVLFARAESAPTITVKSALRGQLLTLSKTVDGLFVGLAPQACPAPELGADLAGALLNRPGIALASPPAVASVGSPKLLLEVSDSATLRALRPNLELIAAWSKQHGVSGCYAYARLADGNYEGRNFNHLDPALEDSATGVAAGALTLHLGHGLQLFQGQSLGQDCLIRSQMRDGRIWVGGAVENSSSG